ncbi:hypothetical protein DYH09_03045 [bacterium CPR1]|nr:hypothetical protein [bacterium CPR1]
MSVFKKTDKLTLHTVAPPVALKVEHLPRLHRLSWWTDGDSWPALRLLLPAGSALELDFERLLCQGKQTGQQLEITCEKTAARWEHPRRLERLGAALTAVPDGTELELAMGGDAPATRYRGTVSNKTWHISESSLKLTGEVLARALELSRQCDEEDWLEAGSLAAEVARGFQAEWNDPCEVRVQGTRIFFDDADEDRSWLLLCGGEVFLREPSFQKHFPDLEKVLREREKESQALQQSLSQLGASFNQAMGIKSGELILKGKKSAYHRSSLVDLPWLTEEDVDLADRELAELGYEPVGDLMADAMAGAMLRGYCRPGGTAWASITTGAQGEFIREFFSNCEDGSSLTTTTLPEAEARPARKLLKLSCPELEVRELLAAHEAELKKLGLKPGPTGSDLIALAADVDDYLVRWM